MPVQDARQRPPAGRLDDHVFDRRSAGSLPDRGPRHRLRREPRRCAGDASTSSTSEPVVTFRFDTQGRAALRPGDAAECRPPLRHRARQPGDHRAADPRADPRRLRPDRRQFHGAERQRPCRAAARRRAAGDARPSSRSAPSDPSLGAGFDPRRHDRRHHRRRPRRRLHGRGLRLPRLLRQHRAGRQRRR